MVQLALWHIAKSKKTCQFRLSFLSHVSQRLLAGINSFRAINKIAIYAQYIIYTVIHEDSQPCASAHPRSTALYMRLFEGLTGTITLADSSALSWTLNRIQYCNT